jgi:flagellar biosynthesis protein FliR
LLDIGFEAQKFILVFTRALSVIWLLPLFQSRSVSTAFKAVLSLSVAFLLYPLVETPHFQGDGYLILIAVGKEVFIGLAIGFFVRVLFAMVSAAAELMSMQSGLSFARSMDPTLMTSVTVLEQFHSLLAMMIFLSMDGHHTVLRGLAASFRYIPAGAVAAKPALLQYLIHSAGGVFAASLKICAPVVVTLFLVDLGLGILSRLIPQINILIEGAPIKMLLTLSMLALALNFIVPVINSLFNGMESGIFRILKYMV